MKAVSLDQTEQPQNYTNGPEALVPYSPQIKRRV
jgi:hypothetical protein